MDPPGTRILLEEEYIQEQVSQPSPSNRHCSDVNEHGPRSRDQIQSSSNEPVVSASDLHTDGEFGPRYKDQANSVAHGEHSNHIVRKRSNVDAPPTDSRKSDSGPRYKDQVNDSSNEVFLSSNHLNNSEPPSNNSSNVPIVQGILIPPEMLTDEERRSSGQEGANSGPRIGGSNQTASAPPDIPTSDERQTQSNVLNDADKRPVPVSSSPKDEHQFWVKVIFGAMFLNTILVACIIVGTFCGIGLCKSSVSSSDSAIVGSTLPPVKAPTLPPVPLKAPTLPPVPLVTVTLRPSVIGSDTPTNTPNTQFTDDALGSDDALRPTSPPLFFTPPPVATPIDQPNTNVPFLPSDTSDPPSSLPSRVPSMGPIFVEPPTAMDTGRRSNLIIYIVPAVIIEFMVVLACLYYYYRRKHPPKAEEEDQAQDSIKESLEPNDEG